MRRILLFILVFCLIFSLLSSANLARGFDLKAHRAISGRAVEPQISNIDDFLKGQLGREFPAGIEQSINGKRVRIWIEEGSQNEDSPLPRVLAHFHNPTRTWGTAGLGVIFRSAVIWAQDRVQTADGNHSWHDARHSYYQALTSRIREERDQAWAEMFENLGHVIHLVQDLATPAHTRNDPHIVGDGFHTWAEKDSNLAIISGMVSRSFDPSILNLDSNPLAPVPIARILDTERYRLTGVPEAGVNIGIAEYSNANFFSDDTIFSADFPFPNEDSIELGPPEPEPKTEELRRYFKKVGDGETIDHLAVPSALFETLQDGLAEQEKGLDDRVFEDYASLLIPRAIGYSAGLIDYFFRGRMSVTKSENQPSSDTLVNLNVANATSASDWPGNSETDVGGSTGKVLAVAFSNGVVLAVSAEKVLSTPITRTPQEFEFDFSPTSIPVNADLMVVYRGPLGLEDDAVIAGFVPTVVTDDFTRVVQPNSDMGPNWTEFETQTPDIVKTTFQTFEDSGDGQLELASSADCEPSPRFPGEYGYAIWSANAFEDDQSSTATVIERIAGMGSGHPLDTTVAFIGGLGVRMQGTITNFTGYIAVWFQPHLGTLSFRVYKIINRSLEQDVAGWTQLGADIDPVPAVGQVIKLEAKDNLITVDIDGVNVFSVLDDTPFFGGNPGFVSATEENDCNIHFNRGTWDNWIGRGVIQNV